MVEPQPSKLTTGVRFSSSAPQKIKSSHQAMLMIKSTQVDFFVAIVKKGVMWYDKSRRENEVTPDVAHEIGVKFAEEMFKDCVRLKTHVL